MELLKKERLSRIGTVASIVLAGGEGSRLRPLTSIRCKPAVSFGGKYRLIDIPISHSLNSQINKIFVISQYLPSSLKSHVEGTYTPQDEQPGDLEFLSPNESTQGASWFKGTADAVRKNWDHLSQTPVEYFLILSGDQLYNIDFLQMLEFAKNTDADLVIASLSVEEAEAKRMGLLKTNDQGLIIDFIEKPSDPALLKNFQISSGKNPRYLGSMGIYVFKKEALSKLLAECGDDFGHDLIPKKVKSGNAYTYVYDGYWEDIGTIGAFYRANLALTEQNHGGLDINDKKNPIYSRSKNLPETEIHGTKVVNSLISSGSVIEASSITHSVIGVSSCIHKGTIIEDSVILGNHADSIPPGPLTTYFSIGENCIIKKAIIDEQTHIGNNVRLINQANLTKYDGDGVFIRDGIIVVTSGANIPDGFTL